MVTFSPRWDATWSFELAATLNSLPPDTRAGVAPRLMQVFMHCTSAAEAASCFAPQRESEMTPVQDSAKAWMAMKEPRVTNIRNFAMARIIAAGNGLIVHTKLSMLLARQL